MNPFQASQMIGNRIAGAVKSGRDKRTIEEILMQAKETGGEEDIADLITRVSQQVSPERQEAVIKALQGQQERKAKGRRKQQYKTLGFPEDIEDYPAALQKSLAESKEVKPALTMNEALNQAKSRYDERVKNLKTPFEKRDAYGSIFLDFTDVGDEKIRKVLEELNEQIDGYHTQIVEEYTKRGLETPGDVKKQLYSSLKVTADGETMELGERNILDAMEKREPAKNLKEGFRIPSKTKGKDLVVKGGKWVFEKR